MRKILVMVFLFIPAFVCAETIEYALPVGNVPCDVGTETTDTENIKQLKLLANEVARETDQECLFPQIYVVERLIPSLQITPKLEKRIVTVVPTDLEVKGTIKSKTTTHLIIWNIVLSVFVISILL